MTGQVRYELILTPDDNGTLMVTAPAFPEVSTFGRTKEQALKNGRYAVEEAIAARTVTGVAIPACLVRDLEPWRFACEVSTKWARQGETVD